MGAVTDTFSYGVTGKTTVADLTAAMRVIAKRHQTNLLAAGWTRVPEASGPAWVDFDTVPDLSALPGTAGATWQTEYYELDLGAGRAPFYVAVVYRINNTGSGGNYVLSFTFKTATSITPSGLSGSPITYGAGSTTQTSVSPAESSTNFYWAHDGAIGFLQGNNASTRDWASWLHVERLRDQSGAVLSGSRAATLLLRQGPGNNGGDSSTWKEVFIIKTDAIWWAFQSYNTGPTGTNTLFSFPCLMGEPASSGQRTRTDSPIYEGAKVHVSRPTLWSDGPAFVKHLVGFKDDSTTPATGTVPGVDPVGASVGTFLPLDPYRVTSQFFGARPGVRFE